MRKYFLRLMGPPSLFFETGNATRQEIPLAPASLSLLTLLGWPGYQGGTVRERLAESMSPGCDPQKSASRLSSAICRLRHGLGEHCDHVLQLSSGHQVLSLTSDVEIDVVVLRTACDALIRDTSEEAISAVEAALDARTGEILDGMKDEWVEDARRDCAEIYGRALERLIVAYREAGDLDHSITVARSLIREDPYREDIHAVLLELYGRKGQRGRAADHYAGCCEVLKTDLGVDPGQRLQASLQSALEGAAPSTPDPAEMYRKILEMDRTMRAISGKIDKLIERRSTGGTRQSQLSEKMN